MQSIRMELEYSLAVNQHWTDHAVGRDNVPDNGTYTTTELEDGVRKWIRVRMPFGVVELKKLAFLNENALNISDSKNRR